MSAEMPPRDSATFFDDTRGLDLYGLQPDTRGHDWGEAFALGFREAVERVKEVADHPAQPGDQAALGDEPVGPAGNSMAAAALPPRASARC